MTLFITHNRTNTAEKKRENYKLYRWSVDSRILLCLTRRTTTSRLPFKYVWSYASSTHTKKTGRIMTAFDSDR